MPLLLINTIPDLPATSCSFALLPKAKSNSYIKELHDEPDGVYLISLNQKYRPIQVLESDSFKIFGKVIGKCKGAEIPGFH